MNKMTSGKLDKLGSIGNNKNTTLKIFGASEMTDKTPTNCIPKLLTLTVSKMVLTKPINVELSSVYLVIKMAHSRRTIRSSEININSSSSPIINKELINDLECSPSKQNKSIQQDDQINNDLQPSTSNQLNKDSTTSNLIQNNESNLINDSTNEQNTNINLSNQQSPITPPKDQLLYALSPEQQFQQHLETLQLHTIELETKIVFTFQYSHLFKKGSNQLQIMIQRRKKYKNRAILGFKTLAIGYINLAEIFANNINVNSNNNNSNLTMGTSILNTNQSANQQPTSSNNISTISTNQTFQQQSNTQQPANSSTEIFSAKDSNQQQATNNLCNTQATINEPQSPNNIILIHPDLKIDLKCSEMVKKQQTKPQHINKSQLLMANIVISSLSIEPIPQEHRRQKSLDKAMANQTIQESEDEEFFNWNEDNSDTDAGEQSTSQPHQEQSNSAKQKKLNKWRRQMNSRKESARKLFASLDNKNTSDEQRNLNVKQRLVNLIRKLSRIPDSASFDSQEQYEAALEHELMVNVDNVEDEQDIEDLLAASVNLDEGDVCLDDLSDLSDCSTQEFDDCLSITSTPKPSLRPFFSHSTLGLDADDDLKNYVKKQIQEEENEEEIENQIPESTADSTDAVGFLQSKNRKWNEKRSKLFSKTTNYITMNTKDRKSLMTIIKLLAKHKNQNLLPKELDNNLKKSFFEQLEKMFPSATEEQQITIPEQISFIQSNDFTFLSLLKSKLIELNHSVIETLTFLEMKTTFSYLVNRIQKFCNCNSKSPNTIKICIFGSDAYINTVLRAYVDYLSNKSPEWQSYFRFYPIPLCNSGSITLSLFLGTIDQQYQSNFCNGKWNELFDNQNQANLVQELINRVKNYLNNSTITVQVPIAESMIMYKTAQAFIPFICSVKIGFQQDNKNIKNTANISIEEDKQEQSTSSPPNNSTNTAINTVNQMNKTELQNVINNLNNLSTANTSTVTSSNGANNSLIDSSNKEQQQILQQQQSTTQQSPPTSPKSNIQNILSLNQGANQQQNTNQLTQQPFSPTTLQSNTSPFILNNGSNLVSPESKLNKDTIKSDECLDLQIDYWITSAKQQLNAVIQAESSSNRKTEFNNKTTLKNTFRTLQISRLPCITENQLTSSPSLTLSYLTKEKKQKIMRLGKKKDRDPDIKFQVVEGIHRLVCSYKNSSLKVNVDGVDWTGVKFFQLTAQWQTHIKSFPIALFSSSSECPLLSTNITKSNRI